MVKRQDMYNDIRREVEERWESWPEQKQPSSSTHNMLDFYWWLDTERSDLAQFKESASDECWQQIKSWLIGYEERKGRSIYHKGPSLD